MAGSVDASIHMDTLTAGHYWKTPFVWEPGMREPPSVGKLSFDAAPSAWWREAIGAVMASSMDESDVACVASRGLAASVDEVFAVAKLCFEDRPGWWQAAIDEAGQRVGFVITSVFADARRWRNGQAQASILYMGVLPEHRGHGHARELLHQAMRLSRQANCWRLFCDTGSGNTPMVEAFRATGFEERARWQRPLL